MFDATGSPVAFVQVNQRERLEHFVHASRILRQTQQTSSVTELGAPSLWQLCLKHKLLARRLHGSLPLIKKKASPSDVLAGALGSEMKDCILHRLLSCLTVM